MYSSIQYISLFISKISTFGWEWINRMKKSTRGNAKYKKKTLSHRTPSHNIVPIHALEFLLCRPTLNVANTRNSNIQNGVVRATDKDDHIIYHFVLKYQHTQSCITLQSSSSIMMAFYMVFVRLESRLTNSRCGRFSHG